MVHVKKNLYWICYNNASVLCFVFFGHEVCGVLVPWPGIEPIPPALEGDILPTGPPGKSLAWALNVWLNLRLRQQGRIVSWAEKTGAGVPTCHTKETCLTCVAWRLGCVMPELGSILWQPYTQVCQKASHNACGGPVNTWCLFLVLLFTFKSDLMWKIIASVVRVKL